MTVDKPRVTIGMPIYNGEKYLTEVLKSLLSQTFTDFELVITDNASTDQTPEIIREFAVRDTRIHYHRNPTNLGAAGNYNILVELACGKYFKWAAADDLCAPTLIEKCVAQLDEHPEAIMAYGRTILIDEHGGIIEYHDDEYDLRSPKAHVRLRQAFRSSAWCHPVFGLVRTDELKQTGLIGNFASSDKVLLAEFALRGQCHEVPEHLASHRLHPGDSTSVNTTDEAMASWFDPQTKNRVRAPRWQRMLAVAQAIRRTKLSPVDAVLTYIEFFKFYLSFGRFPGMFKDFRQMIRIAWIKMKRGET